MINKLTSLNINFLRASFEFDTKECARLESEMRTVSEELEKLRPGGSWESMTNPNDVSGVPMENVYVPGKLKGHFIPDVSSLHTITVNGNEITRQQGFDALEQTGVFCAKTGRVF